MKIVDLAALMGKTIDEVKEILDQNEIIELKLTEKHTQKKEDGNIEIIE